MSLINSSNKKRARKNVSAALRLECWSVFLGPGTQKTICSLCGIYEISKTTNRGFELHHIIAEKFNPNVNIFYIYPGCASCNSECSTHSLFDFLYVRGRYRQLKHILWQIFTLFTERRGDELHYYNNSMARIIQHLYGYSRFSSGGFITNTEIYSICQSVQADKLAIKAVELSESLKQTAQLMQDILEEKLIIEKPQFA